MFHGWSKYTAQVDAEDSEEEKNLLPSRSSSTLLNYERRSSWNMAHTVIGTIVLCTVLNISVAVWLTRYWRGDLDMDKLCIRHISQNSQLVEELKPNWDIVDFQGSFMDENIYRSPPSPETDKAWEDLGVDYRSVIISESDAEKNGLRPDHARRNKAYGGGIPATVEALHHMHCLNLLRKTMWWNYEYYAEKKEVEFVNSERVVQIHATHCLDILRQQLMCKPDVGVFGQVWYYDVKKNNSLNVFVDFNTKHKCRNYEAMRKWSEEHQMPEFEAIDNISFYEPPKPGIYIRPDVP